MLRLLQSDVFLHGELFNEPRIYTKTMYCLLFDFLSAIKKINAKTKDVILKLLTLQLYTALKLDILSFGILILQLCYNKYLQKSISSNCLLELNNLKHSSLLKCLIMLILCNTLHVPIEIEMKHTTIKQMITLLSSFIIVGFMY